MTRVMMSHAELRALGLPVTTPPAWAITVAMLSHMSDVMCRISRSMYRRLAPTIAETLTFGSKMRTAHPLPISVLTSTDHVDMQLGPSEDASIPFGDRILGLPVQEKT